MLRRSFSELAVSALLVLLSASAGLAQPGHCPGKPLGIILPYGPAGAADRIGRPWSEKLTRAFGQLFVIEHRSGASSMMGTEVASKAAPDGYTLLITPNAPLTVPPRLRKCPYEASTTSTAVAGVDDTLTGLGIYPSDGVKSFPEMAVYAEKRQGKPFDGSAGFGATTHMRVAVLEQKAGLDILNVSYRGRADALNSSFSGTIRMTSGINVLPHDKVFEIPKVDLMKGIMEKVEVDVPMQMRAGAGAVSRRWCQS